MKYQVKLEIFEGPFDLLLELITRQRIDIHAVSLTAIVTDYVNYLQEMKRFDLEVASEFLVIAATLLKIKASSLFSCDQEDETEEFSPAEARELLIARLLEYKQFKNAASQLSDLLQSQHGFYKRQGDLEKRILARTDLLQGIAKEDLAFTLISLLIKSEGEIVISTDHILSPPVNLNDKMNFVFKRLQITGRENFRNLTRRCRTKIEAAVTFLALLELYRRRIINIRQIETFGEIEVELVSTAEELPVFEPYAQDISGKFTNK